ncbi:MAG TPA: flagellar assembly protein FliW [Opitutaceae bacterium]|jgi:flagellar assembly factor FliW
MKVLSEQVLPGSQQLDINEFTLPQGIVGFPNFTQATLVSHQEQAPFWMKLKGPQGSVSFVVVEPKSVIPDYEPELFENDALALGLSDASEALVLNILTMRPGARAEATINLVGPIVVNRRTRVGRQLVIANYSQYRARQPLASEANTAAASA